MNALLSWLLPPMDWPGRRRSYHQVIWIFGGIPAAVWVAVGIPVAYTALVLFIAIALLLAWLL